MFSIKDFTWSNDKMVQTPQYNCGERKGTLKDWWVLKASKRLEVIERDMLFKTRCVISYS